MKKATPKKLKVNKTPQDTTPLMEITKSKSWMDALYNEAFCLYPGNDEWLKRFIYTMTNFFDNEEILLLEEFTFAYKIPQSTFDNWRNKYPELERAVSDMKKQIGARRHKGTITGKYRESAAFRDMHVYDPKWIPINAYNAALKEASTSNDGQALVVNEQVFIGRKE